MRYLDFRDRIRQALLSEPGGLTWVKLRERLDLPYERPCPSWVKRMEAEIGLLREKGPGRAYLWKTPPRAGETAKPSTTASR